MKNRYKYLLSLFLLLIGVFLIGKIVFMLYNQSIESLTIGKMLAVWVHGLPLYIVLSPRLLRDKIQNLPSLPFRNQLS